MDSMGAVFFSRHVWTSWVFFCCSVCCRDSVVAAALVVGFLRKHPEEKKRGML